MQNKEFFLNPGELIFSKKEIVIKTILGSCVAVSLHDKKNKYGGMCHFLLPESEQNVISTKYGNIAVLTLIKKFLKAGCSVESMEASIIGGAFIMFNEKEIFFIGDRNSEIARQILKNHKIKIKSINTGGEHGKRVIFNTYTNTLIVQPLELTSIDDLYNPGK